MAKKRPTPNDQRSIAKNPNNPAFKKVKDNRSKQLNPEESKPEKGSNG